MMFFNLCIKFFAPSEAVIENVDYFVCMAYVLTGIQVNISNKLFVFSKWLWETLSHIFCGVLAVVYKNSLKQKFRNDWGFAEFYHNRESCRVFCKLWFTYGSMIAIKLLLLQALHFFKEIIFIHDSKAEIQIVSEYTISSKQFLCFDPVLCFQKDFWTESGGKFYISWSLGTHRLFWSWIVW